MRSIQNTLLSRWFQEAWNSNNRAVIDEILADNIKAHGLGPNGFTQGIDEFKEFYDDFRKQFSDIHVTVEDVISQDEMESAICKVTATHKESGKKVDFTGVCVAKIKDGKVVEGWNQFDFLKMHQQIGYELTLR